MCFCIEFFFFFLKKISVWLVFAFIDFSRVESLLVHLMKHVLSLLPTYYVRCLDDVIVVFIMLSMLMSKNHLFV
jgi:hypothetical protein